MQLVALERPVAGDQEHATPPEPDKGVDPPSGIVALPEAVAVGSGLMVTVTVGALVDVQPLASLTVRA